MTEKQLCSNCKHLERDGMAGIWCGIHGNNRNYDCPKFEYDWGILTKEEAINHLNRLYYENKQLKKEINMLKVTIGRNEAYIQRMKYGGEWRQVEMTDNYDIIRNEINRVLSNIYKDMNDYLENIITAPSTINRIFKYYTIGLPSDPTLNERYLMFGGTIVRKYIIENPWEDIELQKRLKELRK